MKKTLIAMCVSLLAVSSAWAADRITVRGMKYTGTVASYQDFKLVFKVGGRQKTYALNEIQCIELGRNADFSSAEKLLGATQPDYSKIIRLYASSKVSAKARSPWEQELVQHRYYMTLNKAGKLDKAVAEWLSMCDKSRQSPEILGFTPDNISASSDTIKKMAIRKLDSKAKLLERASTKKKEYLMAIYTYMKTLQTAVGDSAGVASTDTRIASLGGGVKPPPDNNVINNGGSNNVRPDPRPDPPVRIPPGIMANLEKMIPTQPAAVIKKIQAGLPAYARKPETLSSAARVLGMAQLSQYKASGQKDQSLLKAAGVNFLLAFFKNQGSLESLDALFKASEVSRVMGDSASEKATLELIKEFSWMKEPAVQEMIKKADARLQSL